MLKILKKCLLYMVVGYLTALSCFVIFQRSLVFHPQPSGPHTPAEFGIKYEDVYFNSADGTKLHGWWLPNPAAQHTLIYYHGNAASLSRLNNVTKLFYDLGLSVFIFNYRSYGLSDKAMDGLSEDLVVTDGQAAYDWILSKGITEKEIVVWGHSLGSSIAANVVQTRNPKLLVLEGGFPSLHRAAREIYWYFPVPEVFTIEKFETAKYLQNHKMPILFLHADKDTVVPFKLGQELYDATPYPKRFIRLQDIDHNDLPDVWEQYKKDILANMGLLQIS